MAPELTPGMLADISGFQLYGAPTVRARMLSRLVADAASQGWLVIRLHADSHTEDVQAVLEWLADLPPREGRVTLVTVDGLEDLVRVPTRPHVLTLRLLSRIADAAHASHVVASTSRRLDLPWCEQELEVKKKDKEC